MQTVSRIWRNIVATAAGMTILLPAMSVRAEVKSPRLAELSVAIGAGDDTAVEEFWKKLKLTTWACRALMVVETSAVFGLSWLYRHQGMGWTRQAGWVVCAMGTVGFLVLGRLRIRQGKALEDYVRLSETERRMHFLVHVSHVTLPMVLSAVGSVFF